MKSLPTSVLAIFVMPLTLALVGCKSTPAPNPTPATNLAPTPAATFPPRPTAAPAAFKVFHYYNSSFTLTTPDKATDDEIAALVWQLRDATRTHTLSKLKINQKDADAGSTTWFHIYRGAKCASEKFTTGKLPCEASYHATGDYTYSAKPVWDRGILLHNEKETQLWDPDAPYTPPTQSQ
jgi:hypothetical protein